MHKGLWLTRVNNIYGRGSPCQVFLCPVARPTVRRAQVSTRMSHLAVHNLAGSQDAGRSSQVAGRSSQLAARSSGTRYKSQARRSQDAARSSQLACPNRNSIHPRPRPQTLHRSHDNFKNPYRIAMRSYCPEMFVHLDST